MKTALVTGSSKGIGHRIGLDLLNKGYYIYFNGHTQESINQLDKELLKNPNYNNCSLLCQDLSTIESNLSLADELRSNNKYLDVLVLNLGITDRTPFGKIKPSEWNKVFETNLSGAFFLIQSMRNNINKKGKIIFISSISGCTIDSTSISYGVSKGAIHVLVPYLAKEFADKKITVNAVTCGYIDTKWHQGKSKAQIRRITDKCLAKRLGTVQEVSKVVLSIVDNDFINGQTIRVDGGFGLNE